MYINIHVYKHLAPQCGDGHKCHIQGSLHVDVLFLSYDWFKNCEWAKRGMMTNSCPP